MRLSLLAVSLLFSACSKDSSPPSSGAPPAPSGSAAAPAPAPAAPARDPGFCEYAVDGGAPNRGRGGLTNVQSLHWMTTDQPGRSLASWLLVNCGTGKQLNLSSSGRATAESVPRGPKRYAIGSSDAPDTFNVMGPDFASAKSGSLEITAWDGRHVAGAFDFVAGDHAYKGTFDLACPTPGNGPCE